MKLAAVYHFSSLFTGKILEVRFRSVNSLVWIMPSILGHIIFRILTCSSLAYPFTPWVKRRTGVDALTLTNKMPDPGQMLRF
jgi:hypothetical protein